MKKLSTIIILGLVLLMGVIGCSKDEAKESSTSNEKEQESEKREEREYLGVGDSSELERDSAAVDDHIKFTVNSIDVVDEFNEITPEEEQLLLVNVTLEDLSPL